MKQGRVSALLKAKVTVTSRRGRRDEGGLRNIMAGKTEVYGGTRRDREISESL